MRRNVIETVLGGVVLVVAAFFLVFAYTSADLRRVDGYPLTANFSSITGLQNGADVRISGVKVGTVTGLTLDPASYQAVVHLSVDPDIQLPADTAAIVASESLLGGKFLSLEPGGEEEKIAAGGRIQYTQSTPGLEQLLGQVIFSLQSGGNRNDGGGEAPKM
ncbi:outer membrane lipid asymmetry maintenance protein MlaD [Azospirillum sp. ST 5-10]|uniref:outer membrane lipid asymmetry maintenance protein MlaD n=1 Tax=unclassified Azospirillum TaxID=2630922 RepID=UPI003F4A7825